MEADCKAVESSPCNWWRLACFCHGGRMPVFRVQEAGATLSSLSRLPRLLPCHSRFIRSALPAAAFVATIPLRQRDFIESLASGSGIPAC